MIDILISWYHYINRGQYSISQSASSGNKDVYFHTYHGTKGAEFENVAVILEQGFGRDAKKFLNYFQGLNKEDSLDNAGFEDEKLLNTKNLLYVAFSRAIKNLRVLYLDDVSTFRGSLDSLFSQVEVLELE